MEWHFDLTDETAKELKVFGRGERLQRCCRDLTRQYGTTVTIGIAPPHNGALRAAMITGPAEACAEAWEFLLNHLLPEGSHSRERKELKGRAMGLLVFGAVD